MSAFSSYFLHVELGSDCDEESACDCGESDLYQASYNYATSTALEKVFVVSTDSIRLSLNQQLPLTAIAIFVPTAFFEKNLPLLTHSTKKVEGNNCKSTEWCDKSLQNRGFMNRILSQIHPCLTDCSVRGMIRRKSTPADVLLLDIPLLAQSKDGDYAHNNKWISEMIEAIDGEGMTACTDAIIKALPISEVLFAKNPPSGSEDELMLQQKRRLEIPTCPVCIHRINPLRLGLPKPKNYQLCSKFCVTTAPTQRSPVGGRLAAAEVCSNQRFLVPWPVSSESLPCIACHVINDYWNIPREDYITELFCNRCAMQETLWVCLTCGFVGCGHYSKAHAEEHYHESEHPFCLQLVTLRIWDYAREEFVQRGDLIDCASIHHRQLGHRAEAFATPHCAASKDSSQLEDGEKPGAFVPSSDYYLAISTHQSLYTPRSCSDETPQKKATMIGEEYEALLQSALDEQAQHYEGAMSRLRAELTTEQIDRGAMTKLEIEESDCLKKAIAKNQSEIETTARQVLDLQGQEAGYKASSQRLLKEQGVAKELLEKIREEASNEHEQGRMQVEELEQQIDDLTGNLKMRQQFSQDRELSNAQIFGTASANNKKPKRGGKKSRRALR